MRWVVVGASGMLGADLVPLLTSRGHAVVPLGRRDLDLTDPDAVARAVNGASVVVNCAAYTAVDAAQDHEQEAFEVNAVLAATLARAATAAGARMVQLSTDYVFDGDARVPYPEDAPVRPSSAYGRTKAAGEWAVRALAPDHLVVRTAWLYGATGSCFPRTIARVVAERGGAEVIDDQVGQPTWTVDLADLVERLVRVGAPAGVYHGTSSGRTSWFGFARAVIESAGGDPEQVRPISSSGYLRPAPRPSFSVLDHGALVGAGVEPISDWRERWTVAAASVLAGSS